jgi:probable phosphoglycerate mutase
MTRLKRILLVRHGQTDWNVDGRWQGALPVELNRIGWSQARALAAHLQGRPITTIYSSDLPRALQTATAIAEMVGVQPILDPRWREFHLGIFQGLTREEIQATYPDEWHQFRVDYWDYVVPGGESRRMFQSRVYAAWKDVVLAANGSEIVVVTHGGSIKLLLLKLFEGNPELDDFHIENTSVTTVEYDDDQWRLGSLAAIPHL